MMERKHLHGITLLGGLAMALLCGCIRDELEPCPPLRLSLEVADKNYVNSAAAARLGYEEERPEDLPFREYVLDLAYRMSDLETGRVVAERVPECLVVGDQLGEHGFEAAERIRLVETERVAGGVGTVAETFPDLAFLVLVATEEDGFLGATADQHDHGFRLGKAREVPEVAVEAVGVVRIAVADDLRRGRHDGDAIADGFQQAFAAGEKVGVGHSVVLVGQLALC